MENRKPVLVTTDQEKVFLVIPEEHKPGVVQFLVHLSNFWLEEKSEGTPIT